MITTVLIDIFIIMVAVTAVVILYHIKRNKYAREASHNIMCEIEQPTGFCEYHVLPCDLSADSVTINNIVYFLNPEHIRWGKYPLMPFMGFQSLQVPIRKEQWYQDNPNPKYAWTEEDGLPYYVTGAIIDAKVKEIQASMIGMDIQEAEERQAELTYAITNQPNKLVVYILLGTTIVTLGVLSLMVAQIGGVF